MTSTDQRAQDGRTPSEREWLRVRSYLREHRYELARAASQDYPAAARVEETPLLAAPSWVPAAPLDLEAVELELRPNAEQAGVTGREEAAAASLPRRADGSRYAGYSDAVAALAAPSVFENRSTYRLVDADLSGPGGRLVFGRGTYFDGMDLGEACAHEYAAAALGTEGGLGLRALVGDPCDPKRRPTNVAITTLTLRIDRAAGTATFLAHWRDPAKVGHAGGLYQLLPVGIFQASSDAAWNARNDFDLWRCMVREFSEELLGLSEGYGSQRAPIDYDAWPFAARMTQARRDGEVRAFCLGMGVDPLTFATDLLTVTAFDAPVFDELFGGLVDTNAEGRVISSVGEGADGSRGLPFTAGTVKRFVHGEPMQAAGAALLALAWRHRRELLG